MDVKDLELYIRRNFYNAICLIGIIPFLVFIYILVVKLGSFRTLVGEIGWITFFNILLLILGLVYVSTNVYVFLFKIDINSLTSRG